MSHSGRYPNPTIDDVARLAGVSSATVSRVINKSAPVTPEVLGKVEQAILTLNYTPSAAARGLANRKKETLGLLVPEISGPFFVPLLHGIESAASQAGYNLLVYTTHTKPKTEGFRMLGDHNTDGLLIFSNSLPDSDLVQMGKSGFPMVLIYQDAPPGSQISAIKLDNQGGAQRIVEHLIQVHGRKRIVCLRGPEGVNDAHWREEGYRRALLHHGIELDPHLIVPGDFDSERAEETVRGLIQRGVQFDAIFSGDDGSALGALVALREEGISVPEEVSLVGFDDVDFASHLIPALTSVHAPTEQVGKEAVRQLVALIHNEPVESPVLLPTELVIRRSCGCAPEK